MKVCIKPGPLRGDVTILPSKSHLHRLLICAALADAESLLVCGQTDAEDVLATMRCLEAMGATIKREPEGLRVTPLRRDALPAHCTLPCGESGSTLRFLLPIVCALGLRADFTLLGRLPERPLAPLDEELRRHGCHLQRKEGGILSCEGQLCPGDYVLPGNVSSQYITGLLFALPLLAGASSLHIEGRIESADYISMTRQALQEYGLPLTELDGCYAIPGGQTLRTPGRILVEGDWSNAAFWLCAGALPGGDVTCRGLHTSSTQGDREICHILEQMGAELCLQETAVRVTAGQTKSLLLNAAAVPDLVPIVAAVAAISRGETRIEQAQRLRLKESDRLRAVSETLNALGAQVEELPDGLRIQGVETLRGGTDVSAWGDHRIVMMAAILATVCDQAVCIVGAEAVRKSYPGFFRDFAALGGRIEEEAT